MLAGPRADQYFVMTRSHGRPLLWTWEIQRRPKELGIKLERTDFKTDRSQARRRKGTRGVSRWPR